MRPRLASLMFDPGQWLPLLGVVMLAGTTVISIVGAYAFGRLRGADRPLASTRGDRRMRRIITPH